MLSYPAFRKGLLLLLLIPLTLSCCKKDTTAPEEPAPAPLITTAGTPDGTPVTQTIGAAGGTLTSADGRMKLVIPAGALSEDREITMQPVTRQLPYGYGRAYRLTPHDISFAQPVTVTFYYEEDSIRNTAAELLGIAYQDQSGQWFSAGEALLDKTQHTLSVNTTHFSDWGYFPYFFIVPGETLVDPGAQLELKVLATIPDDFGDISGPDGVPLTQPAAPSIRYLGAWDYAGEGLLEGDGNKAHYEAPNTVPHINPEAVSVTVKMKGKGDFQLVSNITIRNDFHIDYMQVDETEKHAGGLDYDSRLWLYGSFGADPGPGKRTVTINNHAVTVAIWTPGWIACDIPTTGPGSSGMVEVTAEAKTTSKLLNEWVVNLYYEQKQSPDGALTKKVNVVLHLRGDAAGFFRTGQVPKVSETNLHSTCQGIIEMPSGTFSNHVTMDACGDYKVSWDAISHLVIERKLTGHTGDGLSGSVVNKPDGFDIKLRFYADNVLMTHRQFISCTSGSTLDHVPEYIQIEGFHEVTIPLRFSSTDDKALITAGQMPERTGSPAAGLYWDAPDYVPEQFTIKLHWDAAHPEFE